MFKISKHRIQNQIVYLNKKKNFLYDFYIAKKISLNIFT